MDNYLNEEKNDNSFIQGLFIGFCLGIVFSIIALSFVVAARNIKDSDYKGSYELENISQGCRYIGSRQIFANLPWGF
jgi:hypothetical protein